MDRAVPLSFDEDIIMTWIANVLLLTATISVALLWYLLSKIFNDSP